MEDRSFSSIFKDIMAGFSGLVRSEIRLAKLEATQSAKHVTKDMIATLVFAVIAVMGGLAFLSFCVIGLGELLGDNFWLSSLILAVFFGGIGALGAYLSVKRVPQDVQISRMQGNLEQDRQLLEDKAREIARVSRKEFERGVEPGREDRIA